MFDFLTKIFISTFLVPVGVAFSQNLELESLSHWELHGPVHTVIERTLEIKQKEGITTEEFSPIWSQKTFNEKGLLVENVVYRDDVVARRLVLNYNDAGQLVETIAYLGESIEYIQTKSYDDNGIWVKTTNERNGETSITSINSQYLDFDPKKHDVDLSVLTLNDAGKPVERLDYEPSRGFIGKIVYGYNENGI